MEPEVPLLYLQKPATSLEVLTAAEFSKIFAVWQPSQLIWHSCQQAKILLIPPLVPVLSQIKPIHTSIPLSEDQFQYYLPAYQYAFQVVFSPSDFPTKTWYAALFFTFVLHTPHLIFLPTFKKPLITEVSLNSFFWADQLSAVLLHVSVSLIWVLCHPMKPLLGSMSSNETPFLERRALTLS